MKNKEMQVLLLDIETAPSIAYVWRFFKENISPKQVLEHCSMLSFGAKWLGSDKLIYFDTRRRSERALLKKMNALLMKADAIIAHNGTNFDMPKIRGRSLVYGLTPPSPYKEIDTCRIARREFGFDANSLEYLAKVLGCTEKSSHKKFPGFELWAECMKGNEEAWDEMQDYCLQDVETLEEVYLKVRPYARQHPNVAVYAENSGITCPKCGSEHNQKQGYVYTNVGKYQKYQCQADGCMSWHRGRFTEYPKGKRAALTVNIG